MQQLKRLILCLPLALATALAPLQASAQAFPSKPVRWVVPYPAGGGSDFMARTVAHLLPTELNQPVVVDNKPGGNGAVAVSDVVRSAKDGHTLLNVDNGVLVFNPVLYKNLGYNPSRDLRPVTLLGMLPMILLVGPGSDAKTAKDFIAQAKANPGKLSFGSAGAGSPQHMTMELLKKIAGLHMVHIPYRGSAPALADLVGGQIPTLMSDYPASMGFIKSGKVRPLAVAGPKRLSYLPDVPTFAELGLAEVESAAFVGVAAAAGTPDAAVASMQQAIAATLVKPEVTQKYRDAGIEPVVFTPQQFGQMLEAENARWHQIIRQLNISLD
ncbi:MAG TPA: tripartite tricarboxylate transporter substrate binding protein [Pseudorhodoferax sp.]|nr:tripartite tricarboxylate transporter substrate binding protein [Pseudorhodoferax sp.]